MNKINFAGICLLAFGLETYALGVQSMLTQAQEDHPKPEAGVFAQKWHPEKALWYPNPMASVYWYDPVRLTFENESGDEIELFWHDYEGDLVSYGQLADGQTKIVYTYATHAWSASQIHDADTMQIFEYFVDGHEFFVAELEDNDRVIKIQRGSTASDYGVYTCDTSVNMIVNPYHPYHAIHLTDEAGNPVYAPYTNQADAIAYCQDQCEERVSNGEICEGFFFEKFLNGHEDCGFYTTSIDQGERISIGIGAICDRETFKYELAIVKSACDESDLIESVEECQAAIKKLFGEENAAVETLEDNWLPNGCFKSDTKWGFNHNGLFREFIDESGNSASICRA